MKKSAANRRPSSGQKSVRTVGVNVTRVMDGDSVKVRRSGLAGLFAKEMEIRMYGIDAPELAQSMGQESKQALDRALKGRKLQAEIRDIDRYGRTVALLYHKKRGRRDSVNLDMVSSGYAHWYRRYGGKELGFDRAEADAQAQRRGVWQQKAGVELPWDWRAGRRGAAAKPGKFRRWQWLLLALAAVGVIAAYAAFGGLLF